MVPKDLKKKLSNFSDSNFKMSKKIFYFLFTHNDVNCKGKVTFSKDSYIPLIMKIKFNFNRLKQT